MRMSEDGRDERDVLVSLYNDDLDRRVVAVVVRTTSRLDDGSERVLEKLEDNVGPEENGGTCVSLRAWEVEKKGEGRTSARGRKGR